jgi:hypothetical protein
MPCLGETFSVEHNAPFSQAVRLPLWDWTGLLSEGPISGLGLVMCRTVKPKRKSALPSCGGVQIQAPSFSYGVSDVPGIPKTQKTYRSVCSLSVREKKTQQPLLRAWSLASNQVRSTPYERALYARQQTNTGVAQEKHDATRHPPPGEKRKGAPPLLTCRPSPLHEACNSCTLWTH